MISSMSDAQATEPLPSSSARIEREVFVATVERGLADVEAGRVHSHAEVVAEMRERFPP